MTRLEIIDALLVTCNEINRPRLFAKVAENLCGNALDDEHAWDAMRVLDAAHHVVKGMADVALEVRKDKDESRKQYRLSVLSRESARVAKCIDATSAWFAKELAQDSAKGGAQ